jgi:hypothetical protein
MKNKLKITQAVQEHEAILKALKLELRMYVFLRDNGFEEIGGAYLYTNEKTKHDVFVTFSNGRVEIDKWEDNVSKCIEKKTYDFRLQDELSPKKYYLEVKGLIEERIKKNV